MKHKFRFFFLICILCFPLLAEASPGKLKSSSLFHCDGVLFGSHGNHHYHRAVQNEDGSYQAVGEEIISPPCPVTLRQPKVITVTLAQCVDGDTAKFEYEGKVIKARFLAVDTPETVHPTKQEQAFGKCASDFTCTRLKNAQKIQLEYDFGSTEKDKYDRDLVWVWVDDVLLQKELIQEGYAEVKYLYGEYRYTAVLKEAEKKAEERKVGMWQEEGQKSATDFFILLYVISIIGIGMYLFLRKKCRL